LWTDQFAFIQEDPVSSSINFFPPDYFHGPRLTAWVSLLGAKDFWLLLKIDEHQAMGDFYKKQLGCLRLDFFK
jgi:hypothetical protein